MTTEPKAFVSPEFLAFQNELWKGHVGEEREERLYVKGCPCKACVETQKGEL